MNFKKKVAIIQEAILKDMKSLQVPETVSSYSELHNYTDANMYLVDEFWKDGHYDIERDTDEANKLMDAVGEWLHNRIYEQSIDQSKVRFFRRILLDWFSIHGRAFPWRSGNCTCYEVIIGEILLQRTRAQSVASFFAQFIDTYPSWEELAKSNEKDLAEYLKPLGLYRRRAVVLTSLAQVVVQNGQVLPRSRHDLESLPGVGQYIANAILTICYGAREPLLDVNMARLLERFFGPRKLADLRYDKYLQNLSREILKRGPPKQLNWAALDFAAIVCTEHNPKHEVCPLKNKCLFYCKQS